jgi:hypothetical protein
VLGDNSFAWVTHHTWELAAFGVALAVLLYLLIRFSDRHPAQ